MGLNRGLLAVIIIVALLASAVAAAVFVYYDSINRAPEAITSTTTVTSVATVIHLITAVSIQTPLPSMVTLNGTVESDGDYPIAVDFCSLTRQSLFHENDTADENQITGISCGAYSSPVHITNQTLEGFGSENFTYFQGTYSTQLPNNSTYLLQVRLKLASGANFEEEAGWLPLNYTASTHIADYGIICYNLLNNGSQDYQCNSGFP